MVDIAKERRFSQFKEELKLVKKKNFTIKISNIILFMTFLGNN